MQTIDGRLVVISGASRSGKTAWTKKAVAKSARVVAWDPEDQWAQLPGWKRVTSRAALWAELQKPGKLRVAYVAGGKLADEFDFWAMAVMYAGRYVAPMDCIAEELADVTSVAKAPANWGILLRRGLKRGITIYALSQRWQEADKTALGNASLFVLFRQNGQKSAKYLENMTGVPYDAIPIEPLCYAIFDPTNGSVEHGKLRF